MMMQGTVRHWNREKFYGFIQTQNGSLFFHGSNVLGGADDLHVGDAVEFEHGSTPRGPCAVRIELLEMEEASAG